MSLTTIISKYNHLNSRKILLDYTLGFRSCSFVQTIFCTVQKFCASVQLSMKCIRVKWKQGMEKNAQSCARHTRGKIFTCLYISHIHKITPPVPPPPPPSNISALLISILTTFKIKNKRSYSQTYRLLYRTI